MVLRFEDDKELAQVLRDNPGLSLPTDAISIGLVASPCHDKPVSGIQRHAAKPTASLAPMSEEDLASTFDDLATLRGWTWCGFRPARQRIKGVERYRTPVIGQKGFPDRVLSRNGVVLLVELKAERGRLSPEQKIWAESLKGFSGYHVIRPSERRVKVDNIRLQEEWETYRLKVPAHGAVNDKDIFMAGADAHIAKLSKLTPEEVLLTPHEIDRVYDDWTHVVRDNVSKQLGNAFSHALAKAQLAKSSTYYEAKIQEARMMEISFAVVWCSPNLSGQRVYPLGTVG